MPPTTSLLTRIKINAFATLLRSYNYFTTGYPSASPDEILAIPSRDGPGRTIKVHVYHPSTSQKDNQKPPPVLINFHGSGFVLALHGQDDAYCRHISTSTPYLVLDSAYRLSPTHPFPSALEDAQDIIAHVLAHPETYDTSRVALSGFSAGANLALAAAAALYPPNTFRALAAFYPATDAVTPSAAKVSGPDAGIEPRLKPWVLEGMWEGYLQTWADKADVRVSPLFAEAERFPRSVVVITAAGDNLCMEGEALAEKLRGDGEGEGIEAEADSGEGKERRVVLRRMEGCNHGFDKNTMAGSVEERAKDEAYGLVVEMLMLALES